MFKQLPISTGYDPNPLENPAGMDWTGLPPYLAQQMENLYYQLYNLQNTNQAGDSTTDWSQTTLVSDKAAYQLGAEGRFLHPTYGVIQARYVQFTKMNPDVWPGAPIGFCDGPGGFQWKATNNWLNSHATGLLGILGSFTVPTEGQYGWVITDGINTQSLEYRGAVPPSPGDLLIWNGSGTVGLGATPIVGRAVSSDLITNIRNGVWEIPPAAVHVTSSIR